MTPFISRYTAPVHGRVHLLARSAEDLVPRPTTPPSRRFTAPVHGRVHLLARSAEDLVPRPTTPPSRRFTAPIIAASSSRAAKLWPATKSSIWGRAAAIPAVSG